MISWAVGIGEVCGAILGALMVANFIFYSKSQVDLKFRQSDEKLQQTLKEIYDHYEGFKKDIYAKLDNTHTDLQSTVREFIKVLSDLKDAEKDKSLEFIKLVNIVKDELKSDYMARYNDLLNIINTKANETDFTRLENKFDKLSETLVELKTTIQLQMKENKKEK